MWYVILILSALGSYLPGTKPKSYYEGDPLNLFVDTLDSSLTHLPFNYYYLNFCRPKSPSSSTSESAPTLSPYEIYMQMPITCRPLCTVQNSAVQKQSFSWMIENEYRSTWFLDTLPSGYRISLQSSSTNLNFYQYGVPLGFTSHSRQHIYNHHHIIIQSYDNQDGTWRVVGFLVQPLSFSGPAVCDKYNWRDLIQVQSLYEEETVTLDHTFRIVQEMDAGDATQEVSEEIQFTYSVSFEPSSVKWTSRWDVYLYSQKSNVHWLAILNSFFVVALLSGMVAYLFRKSVSREIYSINERLEAGESEGGTGWKQLTGDIFRPPRMAGVLSVVLGTGFQLISMAVLTLAAICVGFLTPDFRETLLTTVLFMFASMGCFGGYTATRIYKMLGGLHWKTVSLGTALVLPGACFLLFFLINFLIWEEDSSGAVDFTSLLELLCIWFGISLPLVFISGAIGYRKAAIHNPCKISKIPKPVAGNTTRWIYIVGVLAGSLPFGCMFIELSFVMKSLWHHTMFHYLFGFFFLSFVVLMITSAEISILMTYILLCRENYNWWWFSFMVPGSSGMYMLVYSGIYYVFYLGISRFSSTVLYFGYMLIISTVYTLITGTIGFFSCLLFIRSIYTQVKPD